MYESPISITEITDNIIKEQNEQFENDLMYQIRINYHIDVDKEQLIRALQYDHEQYEKGYQDGKADAQKQPESGEWLINSDGYYPYCSICKNEPKGRIMTDYCPNCGAYMKRFMKLKIMVYMFCQ